MADGDFGDGGDFCDEGGEVFEVEVVAGVYGEACGLGAGGGGGVEGEGFLEGFVAFEEGGGVGFGVEFDAVGKMVLQGSFRKLLKSQISLDTFQSTLKRATTPDECWSVLRKTYQEFGFYEVRMQLAGNSYAECTDDLEMPDTSCAWRVEIPLTGADYIHLTRECDNSAHQNTVAPFADVLRKTLESKLSDFRTAVEPPRFQTASAGE